MLVCIIDLNMILAEIDNLVYLHFGFTLLLCSALPDPEWLKTKVSDSFNYLMDEWFGLSGYAPRDVSDVQSVSSLRSE